ncbi:MAG: hypothetical protein ACYDAG_09140, partial [Chloroflexota bacterium]
MELKPYRQQFDRAAVEDIPGALGQELARLDLASLVKRGQRIALGAGSRGIANYPLVLRLVAQAIRAAGGAPFVVPAMGSHGGATAEGQKNMLAGLGVSEESIGAPVLSSMETVEVGRLPGGQPVY